MQASVLIVDDDASVRRSLARLLRAHGYGVVVAEDAGALSQLVEAHHPALVLIDMVMTGDDPLETVRRLKSRVSSAPPVIALTASPPLARADRVLFAAVLTKPCDAGVLMSAIESALAAEGSKRRAM